MLIILLPSSGRAWLDGISFHSFLGTVLIRFKPLLCWTTTSDLLRSDWQFIVLMVHANSYMRMTHLAGKMNYNCTLHRMLILPLVLKMVSNINLLPLPLNPKNEILLVCEKRRKQQNKSFVMLTTGGGRATIPSQTTLMRLSSYPSQLQYVSDLTFNPLSLE